MDIAIAQGLQRRGVEAFSARDCGKLGLTDEEQLFFTSQEKATIFTHNADFFKIAAMWNDDGKIHCGMIYCQR